jgi:hypothetical protein
MDPMTLLVIPSIALDIVLAIAIMRGRTVGGLTFCQDRAVRVQLLLRKQGVR